VCRSIKSTSLSDASEDLGISNFGELFGAQIEKNWGREVSGQVLRYDQDVLIAIYLSNSTMGCCTTINHFTALQLVSVWNLIAS
jgi:hypothetical protein